MLESTGFPMKLIKSIAITLILGFGLSHRASADPILGTMSIESDWLSRPFSNFSLLVAIGPLLHDPGCYVVGACPQLALLEGLDSGSVGTSIIIDPSSAAFAGVASKLTNASLDYIFTSIVFG